MTTSVDWLGHGNATLGARPRFRSRFEDRRADGSLGYDPIGALIVSGNPMNGTADDDFMFGFFNDPNNTINANAGDDLVLGEIGQFSGNSGPSSNGTRGSAWSLDSASIWTTDENPLFGDDSIPHATVYVAAGEGQEEFYSLTIGAGETITIDIDYGGGIIGAHTDTVVDLLAPNGDLLATNNDSSVALGGWGSADGFDSYLSFTVPAAGLYFIRVYESVTPNFEGGEEFLLNVSLTGQATIPGAAQGADTIDGGDGDDQLFGLGANDFISGAAGDDLILCGSGPHDYADGGVGADTLYGGTGSDTLSAGGLFEQDYDYAFGGDGDDAIYSGGDGLYLGEAGSDIVYAGLAGSLSEFLDGGDGIDTLTIYVGSLDGMAFSIDMISGQTNDANKIFSGFENLAGSAYADTITGTNGANRIQTNGGDDWISAGGGRDTLIGDAGADTLDGGGGLDWADYSDAAANVRVDLQTPGSNTGDAAGDSYVSIENLRGSAGADALSGDKKVNRIEGLDGDDALTGRKGDDTLAGGGGRDRLAGGGGADRFELARRDAHDADRILDFATGDEIALRGEAYGLTPGALGGNRFVLGTGAQDASDRIIYNQATGKLWFDADGSGAQAKVLIATLTNTPTLAANDFTVI